METKNEGSSARSLPPLVEGKVHGYLRLVIDEIVWCRRSPGDVTVLASWWGELDSAHFRPADIKSGDNRLDRDITETYAVRTNLELFEEYLTNCETVELVVISEKTHQIAGTARAAELYNVLSGKSYFQYVPILNDSGNRIGDVHVTMKLLNVSRNPKSPSKTEFSKKKPADNKILFDDTNIMETRSYPSFDKDATTKTNYPYDDDVAVAIKNAKQNENIYRSILKSRKYDTEKSSSGVNDNLVAQVVARAQRLRGAILKETRDDDPLALSEDSSIDGRRSDESIDKEATLYEYFLGKKMTRYEEKKALETLRSTSPTPSLMNLAAETIRTCRNEQNPSINVERTNLTKTNKIIDDFSLPISASLTPKELAPIDHVDSLRIVVESLTLSPAGYRRVKSSCLSRGDGIPISVTYFVQYDASIFANQKKFNRKIINESKPVKLCSKKQIGQVIYFNHEAVYDLPKTYLRMDKPLKFKIFNRHLNQRTPTELGIGSMYVVDASRVDTLSSTQRLAVVNKGIKIGELKVTAELGCDKIHFGKQFVEAVTSAKENIPVIEVSSVSSLATDRHRKTTGNDDRTNGKPSENRLQNRRSGNDSVNFPKEDPSRRSQRNTTDNEEIAMKNRDDQSNSKVLLHGLIHVAEGKDLTSTSTYLICRAFWREDRTSSRICEETNNPFYNFHQLVPLIHGSDLLERTKDNCIVIEIYSRNFHGPDNLLGISKLPVHQLYVAYRDYQVLPYLLRSKYPVISVDGWVTITDPVTGQSRGQILALVALGTADQIALLEMTRGLRDSSVTSRTLRNIRETTRNASEISHTMANPRDQENPSNEIRSINETRRNCYDASRTSNDRRYVIESFPRDSEQRANDKTSKTQECQTEITTVKYFKPRDITEESTNDDQQSQMLNAIVDRLAQALHVPKPSADQAAQTEIVTKIRDTDDCVTKTRNVEPLNLGRSTNNSFSEDDDGGSHPENFQLTDEIYRSVGVGAEFDDPTNQGPSTSYANVDSTRISGSFAAAGNMILEKNNLLHGEDVIERDCPNVDYPERLPTTTVSSIGLPSTRDEAIRSESSDLENSSFRAVVEIECALHLPKVEKPDDVVEPCTYVTFQRARNRIDTQYGSYVVTNLCPFSCNPKWDWRCDTKLSNDLLENEEKRLILKVWRLVDPETSMQIDLERDVVIGFSAIDVSVLTVGFPVVSGWFHVMDFTGKCNGQIKISVTPLDNISALGKATSSSNTARPPLPDFAHSNFSSPYPTDLQNRTNPPSTPNSSRNNLEHVVACSNQTSKEPTFDIGLGLGDASMSFLSSSLKQKLTELDEIKKRLQSRLHDVTNTAFNDDYDDDFDTPNPDSDRDENHENGNTTNDSRKILRDMETWQIPRSLPENSNSPFQCATTNGNRCKFDVDNRRIPSDANSSSMDANYTDTGYSTSSNVQSGHSASNGNPSYPEIDDNRFHERSTRQNNTNGFEIRSIFGINPNLPNCRYDVQRIIAKNQTDHTNVRNHGNVERSTDLRDSNSIDPTNVENFSNDEQPIRGTRMHISHLLDKLTSQLGAVSQPSTNQPIKNNIMDLITNLRRNNNFSNDAKCNREINVRTVPTQTESDYVRDSRLPQLLTNATLSREITTSKDRNFHEDDVEISTKTKRREKVSSAIREELADDEINETQDYDELSSHLMTSNVRHMNLDSMTNPLLYPHLIPDGQTMDNEITRVDFANPTETNPDVEAIEIIDTRYTENFNATINNGLNRLRNLVDAENSSRRNFTTRSDEDDEVFRMTPSGISENIDGNIDVTVIHKPCNDDLMASNSVESTTTISLERESSNETEIDDNSSLNSSETSVSAVSRQAPDGGNPVEESGTTVMRKLTDDSQDSSSRS